MWLYICFTCDRIIQNIHKRNKQAITYGSSNISWEVYYSSYNWRGLLLCPAIDQCFSFPNVMDAAIQLELLEIISRAGLGAHVSAREIASQLPTKNPQAPEMVDRILRLLASHSVLTSTNVNHNIDDGRVERLYGLAPVARYFLHNEQNMSLLIWKCLTTRSSWIAGQLIIAIAHIIIPQPH